MVARKNARGDRWGTHPSPPLVIEYGKGHNFINVRTKTSCMNVVSESLMTETKICRLLWESIILCEASLKKNLKEHKATVDITLDVIAINGKPW